MGLQDDAFDLMHVLEGTPEEEAFLNIWNRFVEMEEELEDLHRIEAVVRNAVKLFWHYSVTDEIMAVRNRPLSKEDK